MSTAAIYDPATGQILRVIDGPDDVLAIQAQDGEAMLLVPKGTSDATHHIEDGELVEGALDLRSLDEHKAAKWAELKRARAAAIDAPLVTPYGTFAGNKESRDNLVGTTVGLQIAIGAGAPDLVTWTLADNSTVDLTLAQLQHVGLLMLTKVQTAHDAGRTLRIAKDAAESIQDVLLLQWPA